MTTTVVQTQGMSEPQPPSVHRRILSSEARRLRAESGETQEQVAAACEFKPASLSRWEKCTSPMKPNVVRTLFTHYGVTGERLEEMVNLAKLSERKRGDGGPRVMPKWFEEFAILERDASRIYELALNTVPGLLQTERYARGVLRAGKLGNDVDDHVKTRMLRKESFGKAEPLELWAIIHEGALGRVVGGREVMAEQLAYLVEMAETTPVTIQIIPNAYGAHMVMNTSFQLLRFNVAPDFGLVYLEHHGGAFYFDAPAAVNQYKDSLDHLIKHALPEDQSVQLIKQVAKDLYSS